MPTKVMDQMPHAVKWCYLENVKVEAISVKQKRVGVQGNHHHGPRHHLPRTRTDNLSTTKAKQRQISTGFPRVFTSIINKCTYLVSNN